MSWVPRQGRPESVRRLTGVGGPGRAGEGGLPAEGPRDATGPAAPGRVEPIPGGEVPAHGAPPAVQPAQIARGHHRRVCRTRAQEGEPSRRWRREPHGAHKWAPHGRLPEGGAQSSLARAGVATHPEQGGGCGRPCVDLGCRSARGRLGAPGASRGRGVVDRRRVPGPARLRGAGVSAAPGSRSGAARGRTRPWAQRAGAGATPVHDQVAVSTGFSGVWASPLVGPGIPVRST